MNSVHNAFSRRQILQGLAAAGLTTPLWSAAQTGWPSKPVTMVVPFPAGGGTDAFARPLSAQFSRLTGKQMVIDNRGGPVAPSEPVSRPKRRQTATTCSWALCTTPSPPSCTPDSTTTWSVIWSP